MQREEGIGIKIAGANKPSMHKKVSRTYSERPKDSILDFGKFNPITNIEKTTVLNFDRITRFGALPIEGWHDRIDTEDSQCKQSCVRDCSCVYHCTWLIA